MSGRLETLYLSLTACGFSKFRCYRNCIIHRIRAICTLMPIANRIGQAGGTLGAPVYSQAGRVQCGDFLLSAFLVIFNSVR